MDELGWGNEVEGKGYQLQEGEVGKSCWKATDPPLEGDSSQLAGWNCAQQRLKGASCFRPTVVLG